MQNIFHGCLTGVGIARIKSDFREKKIDFEREDVILCPLLHFHFEMMM